MKTEKIYALLAAMCASLLVGCNDGSSSAGTTTVQLPTPPPPNVTHQADVTCSGGYAGTVTTTGPDANGDGVPDTVMAQTSTCPEYQVTVAFGVGDEPTCPTQSGTWVELFQSNADGESALISKAPVCTPIQHDTEPPPPVKTVISTNQEGDQLCTTVQVGYDLNGNDTLDSEEVTGSSTTCGAIVSVVAQQQLLWSNDNLNLGVNGKTEHNENSVVLDNPDMYQVTMVSFTVCYGTQDSHPYNVPRISDPVELGVSISGLNNSSLYWDFADKVTNRTGPGCESFDFATPGGAAGYPVYAAAKLKALWLDGAWFKTATITSIRVYGIPVPTGKG